LITFRQNGRLKNARHIVSEGLTLNQLHVGLSKQCYKLAYYLKPVATNYDKSQQQQQQIFRKFSFRKIHLPKILHSQSTPSREIVRNCSVKVDILGIRKRSAGKKCDRRSSKSIQMWLQTHRNSTCKIM